MAPGDRHRPRAREIRVGQDEGGVLPAHLGLVADVSPRRDLRHPRPDLRRAREADPPDERMRDERLSDGRSEAEDDVEDAGREVRGRRRLGEERGDVRRRLGRLEDDGVPERERRSGFPERDRHREVPRRDQADDAEGLAERQLQRLRKLGRDHGARLPDGLPRVVTEDRHAAGGLAPGLADRLSDLPGHRLRQLFRPGADGLGESMEMLGPGHAGETAPAFPGLGRRGDGRVDIGGRPLGDERHDVGRARRVEARQRGGGIAPPAVAGDEGIENGSGGIGRAGRL